MVNLEDRTVARYLCHPARVNNASTHALRNMGAELAIPFPADADIKRSCGAWLPKVDLELVATEASQAATAAGAEIDELGREILPYADHDTRETFKQLESWFFDQLRDLDRYIIEGNLQKLQESKSTLRTMKLHHLVRQQHETRKTPARKRDNKKGRFGSLPSLWRSSSI